MNSIILFTIGMFLDYDNHSIWLRIHLNNLELLTY
ncbi:hypothetical protein PT2222_140105 [Paraburkholderia tropica]